ncbi:hypothetical protein [Saccharopolyspora elongata]|uniref:Uncharacterized protein n=1 Tax=Saccharopolyspora elongata TaxID=2530387 RepID=A0A4R4YER8_9PSEU|nr:hypothetical protein [Saccharopolyspora elongata]TDD43183.1 hypothetical protein E1288_27365 [Saccharopolyspora elongata]
MDREELIRRFHTPDSELTPETQAHIADMDAELADKRARGEIVAESLAQRHSEVPLPTKTHRPTPQSEADEQDK